jgi:hypothetical protein
VAINAILTIVAIFSFYMGYLYHERKYPNGFDQVEDTSIPPEPEPEDELEDIIVFEMMDED